jgi:hypothetical protein
MSEAPRRLPDAGMGDPDAHSALALAARQIWEPAGSGFFADALTQAGLDVVSSDIADRRRLPCIRQESLGCDVIITNPPYALAQEFITDGLVAMLRLADNALRANASRRRRDESSVC